MAHHVHLALAIVLQGFQLLRRGSALAVQAEHRAVLRRGNERHDVVQEGAARFDRFVHLDQMLVVDAGNHHRIHFAQNAGGGQHFQPLHLPFGEYP